MLIMASGLCHSQVITFGKNSSLTLGSSSSFYAGGNTSFKGALENAGQIIGFSDLDFVDNDSIGNILLVGDELQEIFGGNVVLDHFVLNSLGTVLLQADEVRVLSDLDASNGVVQTSETSSLIVLGDFISSGGFIEGSIGGFTKSSTVTFPMGAAGFANYISISNSTPDIPLTITCQQPDPTRLLPDEEMVGIADEAEWIIQTEGEFSEALISVDYSGMDFLSFSNGESINADVYEPALVVYQEGDTIYRALESQEATPQNAATSQTSGRIVSATSITIGPEPTWISVAWIPIVDDPEFFVPNVFSPSGFFQENRIFRPFFSGGEISSISISIYNSFNKEIYEYSASGENLDLSLVGWDGKLSGGQVAEEGVYYYSINLVADGQRYQKVSSVLLAN